MNPYLIPIICCWAIFVIYWAVSAMHVKKDVDAKSGVRKFFLARILALIVVFFGVALWGAIYPGTHPGLAAAGQSAVPSPVVGILGVVLCAAGVAFAIWARWHLGKNWSSRPTMKIGHELVTSGPYRFVRHPIYTGVILALFGASLVSGSWWFLVFVCGAIVFIARIKKEERFMMQLFPDQYPAYRARTKALIPFVW